MGCADRLLEKLIKIGVKVVIPGRYVTFQMAEVAVPRQMFAEILSLRPVRNREGSLSASKIRRQGFH